MSSGGRPARSSGFEARSPPQLAGRAFWNPDGTPCLAVGLRNGVPVGHQLEFHERGVVYAEPFVDGRLHGLAKQFGTDGRLLLVSPFEHGTGTDFWCGERRRLAEEHPLVDGKPSGTERWWNEDQKTVYSRSVLHRRQRRARS